MIYDITLKFTPVREDGPKVLNDPELIVDYISDAFLDRPEQEQFWIILLDRKLKPKGRHLVTLGTVDSSLAHPREVFRTAILGAASSIICVHNHPSGDPSPSVADVSITRKLRESGNIIGIELVDHIVVGTKEADPLGRGYYSFKEVGAVL